jgi:hypothetical protein
MALAAIAAQHSARAAHFELVIAARAFAQPQLVPRLQQQHRNAASSSSSSSTSLFALLTRSKSKSKSRMQAASSMQAAGSAVRYWDGTRGISSARAVDWVDIALRTHTRARRIDPPFLLHPRAHPS